MARNKKASEIIAAAIEVLSPDGAWCQGEFHEYYDAKADEYCDRPIAHCAIGGLEAVVNKPGKKCVTAYWYMGLDDAPEVERFVYTDEKKATYAKGYDIALTYLNREAIKDLRKFGVYVETYNPNSLPGDDARVGNIIRHNDHATVGSKKSVLAMFRRAQRAAEKAGD